MKIIPEEKLFFGRAVISISNAEFYHADSQKKSGSIQACIAIQYL